LWQLLGRRSVRLIIAEESTDYKPIPLLFAILFEVVITF